MDAQKPGLSTTEATAQEQLNILSAIEKERSLTASELVDKGRLIQLTEDPPFELSDAADCFRQALEVDPDYVPALNELGYYYYAIEDDAASALPWFERAIVVSRSRLTEAAAGAGKCIAELRSEAEAAKLLTILHRKALLTDELEPELREWLADD